MKKNKIERKTFVEKMGITEVDWPAFKRVVDQLKRVVDQRVAELTARDFINPRIFSDEYSIWLEMTKIEDDESYNKRLADSEKSEQIRVAQRIEKLKKEAKELGLEIK